MTDWANHNNQYSGTRLSVPARLRALLAQPEPVLAPGAYDALSARIVAEAGFSVVYMTGYGTSAGLLGRPDVGLLSSTEMVDNARRIVMAVDRPVIADADTGYGNALNVRRTVQAYENAGVAGIHIEDQVAPKKCGHMEQGKQLIPAEEMTQKLRAAVDARRDPDFMIIARTDARAVEGLDAAIARGKRYRDAGADMIFVEAPQTEAEIEAVARAFDTPLLFNWADSGRSPLLPVERLRELGYRLIIYPVSTLFAATKAMMEVVAEIRRSGTTHAYQQRMIQFTDFNRFIGLPEVLAQEKEYAPRTSILS
ncbi:MAG TPA: isocitrate lyase/PEP mutase family protein [Dehalococcoidia bacterium]|nr:isocitrate lyase/PEP mutase family protein [Dehalococcoidia bacterium]